MSKKLGAILVIGGLAIAGIIWAGQNAVSKKSDAEWIQEGLMEQREAAERARVEALALSEKVLVAPESCAAAKTGVLYSFCDMEPYADKPWPSWADHADDAAQTCIKDAFHNTNAHAFAIQAKTYEISPIPNPRIANFISDLCSASLFTEGIDYGDRDKSVSDLINGFYADRAESSFAPRQDY